MAQDFKTNQSHNQLHKSTAIN